MHTIKERRFILRFKSRVSRAGDSMKKIRFFISVLALTFFHIAAMSAEETQLIDAVQKNMAKNVFNLINQSRVANSLPPLIWSDIVAQQARNHTVDMANKVVPFGHDGFDMRYEYLRQHIPNLTRMGENVAYNQGYPQPGATAVQQWLNSPGHYANIMGDFNLTGVGTAKDPQGRHYFTQIFVKAASSLNSEPEAEEISETQVLDRQQEVSETPCLIELDQ